MDIVYIGLYLLVAGVCIEGASGSTAFESYELSEWNCTLISQMNVLPGNSGVVWFQYTCTGSGPSAHRSNDWQVGPMVFNVAKADLTQPGVFMQASFADPAAPYQLQTIPEMSARVPNSLAGINGGYFWRLDDSTFIDDVCIGKIRHEAEQPASATKPNDGVGDSLLTINGTVISSNCDLPGYNVPVALVVNGTDSEIIIMSRGGRLPSNVTEAIAAGPNLVSYNSTSLLSYVNIPSDDHNVNILEHSANTAVGLVRGSPTLPQISTVFLVTADGQDGCRRTNPTCGITAQPMAYFMKDFLKVTTAMEMDQGGSTTMWINGQPNGGVVSNPGSSPRSVFDGLFVGIAQ